MMSMLENGRETEDIEATLHTHRETENSKS